MRGLDPRIHLLGVSDCEEMMDPRVKPWIRAWPAVLRTKREQPVTLAGTRVLL